MAGSISVGGKVIATHTGPKGAGTVDLDVNKLSLTPSSAPSSPVQGDMYLDSSDNQLKIYNGSFWNNILSQTGNAPDGYVLTADGSGGTGWEIGGKVLQVVSAEFTGAYAASHSGFDNRKTLASLSITPISSSSKLIMHGIFHHGIGPKETNLDGWGHNFGWEIGGTSIARLMHDVWPGEFTTYVTYGPEWFTTTEVVQKIETGHTAGVSKTYNAYVHTDSGNTVLINRCYSSTDTRGLCSFTLMEVL
jgi:hypothetical protein